MEKDKYTYRVTWSEEDQEYVGLCLEFPSLSWLAETQEHGDEMGRILRLAGEYERLCRVWREALD